MPADQQLDRRSSGRAPGGRLDVVVVCAVLAICAAILAGVAWSRPTTATSKLTYTQSGQLAYSAPASPKSVYGSAGVSTGEPVYGSVVQALALTYSYQLRADLPAAVSGTEQLVATVSNGQGLSRSIPLQATVTPFTGPVFAATARLDMAVLRGVAAAFDQVGGNAGTGMYSVAIAPSVNISGRIGSARLNASFDAPIDFTYTAGDLLPGRAGAAPGSQAQPSLAASSNGSVTVPAGQVATLLFGLSVSEVRIASLVLLLVAVLLGGIAGWPVLRQATSDDEPARIAARYGSLIVEAEAVAAHSGVVVVELDSFDDLLRVARRLECPILHWAEAGDIYAVVDSGTLYRSRDRLLPEPAVRSHPPNHSGGNGSQAGRDHLSRMYREVPRRTARRR